MLVLPPIVSSTLTRPYSEPVAHRKETLGVVKINERNKTWHKATRSIFKFAQAIINASAFRRCGFYSKSEAMASNLRIAWNCVTLTMTSTFGGTIIRFSFHIRTVMASTPGG
ncbi:hypothetical protein TNIN_226921 [Trichonephila inaurata madagascariensis]|uniref:Uncharacterized protein n=1 Tax=Trichonephila inaurata madagascariensis TaxID=2747483 RepID=A0A8X6XWH9_9ARAC|nr:hypothetical protein TNIN_226921 [Trichonephila inaurata madagascariensis]